MTRIAVPPSFNFASTVVSHGWYLLAPFRWSGKERVLPRPEILGGRVANLEISFPGGALAVTRARDSVEPRTKPDRLLQLRTAASDFVAQAGNSPQHRR